MIEPRAQHWLLIILKRCKIFFPEILFANLFTERILFYYYKNIIYYYYIIIIIRILIYFKNFIQF